MENKDVKIKRCAVTNNETQILDLLNTGLDPNFEGGWPIRMAARHGSFGVVKRFIQFGANPHLLSESGASTLQLAVYSGMHWHSDKWKFLLSCCDSSQLADGAAVAIVFKNIQALKAILDTGRCNSNIPTTLTGKTVEQLAKGYNLQYLLSSAGSNDNSETNITPTSSPRIRHARTDTRTLRPAQLSNRNLSPSVARFFDQTASQSTLTSPQAVASLSRALWQP